MAYFLICSLSHLQTSGATTVQRRKYTGLLCLPLYRGGRYIPLLLTAHFYVTSVLYLCVLSLPVHSLRLSCRRANTRRWPNVGLLLAHRLRRWDNISRVLGYRVLFDATLNVGQRHRRRANINPAFVQSIVGYYSQYEVGLLTTVEWILASTGEAGPTFNRHCVGIGLHCLTRSPANTRCWNSAGFMLGQRCRLWATIGLALGQRLVLARSVDRPHLCFAHHPVWRY